MPISIINIRKDFPLLQQKIRDKNLVYFDNAATSLKPEIVIKAITKYYTEIGANTHSAHFLAGKLSLECEKSRQTVADFLKTEPKNIIFTKSATEAINLVASGLSQGLQNGDEVLITEMEHHANLVPWQQICLRKEVKLRYISLDKKTGQLDLSQITSLINKKTRVVALTHTSNVLGITNPIEQIIKIARPVGAKIIIDGTQTVVHEQIDATKLDCDFYVFSGHKIFGPTGIGILYGKAEELEQLPVYQTGGDMVETVDFFSSDFQKPPYKFEAGTQNFAGILGLKAGLEYFTDLQRQEIYDQNGQIFKNIFDYERHLLNYLLKKLDRTEDYKILGKDKQSVPMISLQFHKANPLDVAIFLDIHGIAVRTGKHCSHILHSKLDLNSSLRASLSFYNTTDEIDFFADKLHSSLKFLT